MVPHETYSENRATIVQVPAEGKYVLARLPGAPGCLQCQCLCSYPGLPCSPLPPSPSPAPSPSHPRPPQPSSSSSCLTLISWCFCDAGICLVLGHLWRSVCACVRVRWPLSLCVYVFVRVCMSSSAHRSGIRGVQPMLRQPSLPEQLLRQSQCRGGQRVLRQLFCRGRLSMARAAAGGQRQ